MLKVADLLCAMVGLTSSVLLMADSYELDVNRTHLRLSQLGFTLFFCLSLLLRSIIWMAQQWSLWRHHWHGLKVWLASFSFPLFLTPAQRWFVVDLLSAAPIVYLTNEVNWGTGNLTRIDKSSGFWDWLIFARIVQVYRLWHLDFLRIWVATNELRRTFVVLLVTIVCILVLGGGLIYVLERNESDTDMAHFHEAIYFMVVTGSTVGFGDVTPQSVQGRMVTSALIILAIIVLPFQVGAFVLGYLAHTRQGSPYTGKQHVLLIANAAITEDELVELLSDLVDNSRRNLFHVQSASDGRNGLLAEMPDIVVLCSAGVEHRENVLQRVKLTHFTHRVKYIVGSAQKVEHLHRAGVMHARYVFVRDSSRFVDADQEMASDENGFFWAESVLRINRMLHMTVGIDAPRARRHVLWKGLRSKYPHVCVVCISDFKLMLLAAAAVAPGVIGLITNLIVRKEASLTVGDQRALDQLPWEQQYLHGFAHQLYEIELPSCLMLAAVAGQQPRAVNFSQTARWLYDHCKVVMISVVHLRKDVFDPHGKPLWEVYLNPGKEYIMQRGDRACVISPSRQLAERICHWDKWLAPNLEDDSDDVSKHALHDCQNPRWGWVRAFITNVWATVCTAFRLLRGALVLVWSTLYVRRSFGHHRSHSEQELMGLPGQMISSSNSAGDEESQLGDDSGGRLDAGGEKHSSRTSESMISFPPVPVSLPPLPGENKEQAPDPVSEHITVNGHPFPFRGHIVVCGHIDLHIIHFIRRIRFRVGPLTAIVLVFDNHRHFPLPQKAREQIDREPNVYFVFAAKELIPRHLKDRLHHTYSDPCRGHRDAVNDDGHRDLTRANWYRRAYVDRASAVFILANPYYAPTGTASTFTPDPKKPWPFVMQLLHSLITTTQSSESAVASEERRKADHTGLMLYFSLELFLSKCVWRPLNHCPSLWLRANQVDEERAWARLHMELTYPQNTRLLRRHCEGDSTQPSTDADVDALRGSDGRMVSSKLFNGLLAGSLFHPRVFDSLQALVRGDAFFSCIFDQDGIDQGDVTLPSTRAMRKSDRYQPKFRVELESKKRNAWRDQHVFTFRDNPLWVEYRFLQRQAMNNNAVVLGLYRRPTALAKQRAHTCSRFCWTNPPGDTQVTAMDFLFVLYRRTMVKVAPTNEKNPINERSMLHAIREGLLGGLRDFVRQRSNHGRGPNRAAESPPPQSCPVPEAAPVASSSVPSPLSSSEVLLRVRTSARAEAIRALERVPLAHNWPWRGRGGEGGELKEGEQIENRNVEREEPGHADGQFQEQLDAGLNLNPRYSVPPEDHYEGTVYHQNAPASFEPWPLSQPRLDQEHRKRTRTAKLLPEEDEDEQ